MEDGGWPARKPLEANGLAPSDRVLPTSAKQPQLRRKLITLKRGHCPHLGRDMQSLPSGSSKLAWIVFHALRMEKIFHIVHILSARAEIGLGLSVQA